MGIKGQVAHNKIPMDEDELVREYVSDRRAVWRIAKKYGCTIQAIYGRLAALGVERRNGGDANRGTQAGENNPNWGGGRTVDGAGYPVVRVGVGVYEREHRLVAAEKLRRPLRDSETVHHINGNRSDNRPENIVVLPSQSEHMKLHLTSEEARCRGAKGLEAMGRLAALKAMSTTTNSVSS